MQLTTSYLDFLKSDDEANFRQLFHEAQRFAFVYGASTGVIPTLSSFFYIALIMNANSSLRLVLLASLGICAIATGSLAGFIGFLACAAMASFGVTDRTRIFMILMIAVGGAVATTIDSDTISLQLARIFENDAQSESNIGRIALWNQAVDLVLSANFGELLFGRGIGSTNDNVFGEAIFPHGESSFFQAIIEGGLSGLIFRVLPFAISVNALWHVDRRWIDSFYLLGMFLACAVAPVFALYGVQCGLGLVAGILTRRARIRKEVA